MKKEGNIKISSENMMPIIKKWLYSDKDIFLREIVANGIDAITKYKKLIDMGEATDDGKEFCIKISVDKDARTLTVEDNGIGMTGDEVENYITQIAFSGASDFLSKYEKAGGDGIIGHFGLGFYSAYMVSDNVEIFTKSYKDAPAVHWESDGNSIYSIEECEKDGRGTKIVMHIAEGEDDFLQENIIRTLIRKYCSFMPYNIYLPFKGDGSDKPLNDTHPLYTKNPKDCTDEEYKKFYTDTFMDYNEPLFWVHLNMDYPFRLKGILYFPKTRNKLELERGMVKLYCNQVFIADNIKEVIPEFLMLLNGVIDCPDIPLNVSRSFLQNDREVQKISKHITKKVADKLISLFKNDRNKYEECWGDIANFIKFGCIKDNDFYEKVKDIIIYKNLDGKYLSLNDYYGVSEENAESQPADENKDGAENKEKDDKKQIKTVYYVTDELQQAQYIKMFKDAGLDAMVCDNSYIDPHFITFLEYKSPDKVKFARIDADIDGALREGESQEDTVIKEIFKDAIGDDKLTIKTEKLKNTAVPAIINVDEIMRRYSEMGKMYGMMEGDVAKTLVINLANPVVVALKDASAEKQKFAAKHIYLVALLAFKKLSTEEQNELMNDDMTMLENYIK
ncbi:MAG TPA: molecular chaperone HtpG [Candidatus Coproplasma excrementigallinarum]|uniref:Molecular chaperone HtpG n=1 Tax=Candidatus Coproplasma excrementigallinarum TaxID=2840747 RepID=A0A9D1MJE9_9FIRM|nr:molecular chaperone HtpG [Candidatus Coproplasma excrementigallinarum]